MYSQFRVIWQRNDKLYTILVGPYHIVVVRLWNFIVWCDIFVRVSNPIAHILVYMYMFCLFGWHFSSNFFPLMELSPLSVKGWKFGPTLGAHGQWAVDLQHLQQLGISIIMVTFCRAFGTGFSTTCCHRSSNSDL